MTPAGHIVNSNTKRHTAYLHAQSLRKCVALFEIWSSHGGKMSMLVFWVAKPCALIGRYPRFGGTYCLHLQGWSFLKNIDIYLQVHTALQPRRPTSTCITLHLHTYTHAHTHTHTYIHTTHTHIYIYIHTHTQHTHIYIHTYARAHMRLVQLTIFMLYFTQQIFSSYLQSMTSFRGFKTKQNSTVASKRNWVGNFSCTLDRNSVIPSLRHTWFKWESYLTSDVLKKPACVHTGVRSHTQEVFRVWESHSIFNRSTTQGLSLTLWSPEVTVCTTCLNNQQFCILYLCFSYNSLCKQRLFP
jgi:hypothetical protein